MRQEFWSLVERFINLPTAPFVEEAGLTFIREFAAARPALAVASDRFGNLLVHYRRGKPARSARPVLLAAHLDHPGFVAQRMLDRRTLLAEWRGWVRPEYFTRASVRFWHGTGWERGKIVRVIPGTPAKDITSRPRGGEKPAAKSARSFGAESPPKAVHVRTDIAIRPGSPGMWDFSDAHVMQGRLHTRACDDVVGAAAILYALDTLCAERVPGECYAFFTRAEEVGFAGALAAVSEGTLPKRAVVVAIECSKAVTGVSLGAGPVLRVGDRATVFNPAATAFCQTVAEDLAKEDTSFRYQRKLMDGGTCESTVYCHYGYDATGLCLPLLNYHNMDTDRGRIAPEIIDVSDLENLIKWFLALVRTKRKFDGTHPGLDERLTSLLRKNRPALLRTAPRFTTT